MFAKAPNSNVYRSICNPSFVSFPIDLCSLLTIVKEKSSSRSPQGARLQSIEIAKTGPPKIEWIT